MNHPRVFVDTNVLAYAFGPPENVKKDQAIRILNELGPSIVGSTQVIHDLLDGTVISTTPAISAEAIDLSILCKFTLWDALIVQAAIEGKRDKVFSEDFSHRQLV